MESESPESGYEELMRLSQQFTKQEEEREQRERQREATGELCLYLMLLHSLDCSAHNQHSCFKKANPQPPIQEPSRNRSCSDSRA